MKKPIRMALKKLINEKFELNKVYSDPRATAFKTEQSNSVSGESVKQSVDLDKFTTVKLYNDKKIGISYMNELILLKDKETVDKLIRTLVKFKSKM